MRPSQSDRTPAVTTHSSIPPIDDPRARGERLVCAIRIALSGAGIVFCLAYSTHITPGLWAGLRLIAAVCVFWALSSGAILWLIARDRYRSWTAYVSATVDILTVTTAQLAILVTAPLNFVNGPVSEFYFAVIGLAALRNSRALVVYTGLSASLVHLAVSGVVYYLYVPGGYALATVAGQGVGFSFLDEVVRSVIMAVVAGMFGYVTKELRESERHYQDLFDNVPDGILLVSRAGTIRTVNRRFAIMTGLAAETIVGHNVSEFLHLERGGAISAAFAGDRFESSGDLLRGDGDRLDVRVAAILARASRETYVEMSVRDVTGEVQLERQLAQSQKMETLGRLAGGLAHDFNNILGGILGATSLLERNTQRIEDAIVRDKMRRQASIIRDCGERARDVVSRLMSFSRSRSLDTSPIELDRIVHDVVTICRNTFGEGIDIVVDWSGETAVIDAEATSITQALLNLGINAKDAMRGGGRLTIGLKEVLPDARDIERNPEIDPSESYWCVSVADTGIGIEAAHLDKVFDPFFTTKPVGEGTGLGLAMVYNILREHNGYVTVESTPGAGSCFSIFLPQGRPSLLPSHPPAEDLPRGSATVLLVDDEEIVRSSTSGMLIELGYKVIAAADGERALKLFAARRAEIDLVMLDVVMPRMDGREVLRRLREEKPDLKVIIASGYIDEERAAGLSALDVKAFLRKPFTMSSLAFTVAEVLDNQPSAS